jgi:hypothetical protein
MDDLSFYVSIVASCLFTVSEVLPYIKAIKSNGIMECIVSIFKKQKDSYIELDMEPTLNQILQEVQTLKLMINSNQTDKSHLYIL